MHSCELVLLLQNIRAGCFVDIQPRCSHVYSPSSRYQNPHSWTSVALNLSALLCPDTRMLCVLKNWILQRDHHFTSIHVTTLCVSFLLSKCYLCGTFTQHALFLLPPSARRPCKSCTRMLCQLFLVNMWIKKSCVCIWSPIILLQAFVLSFPSWTILWAYVDHDFEILNGSSVSKSIMAVVHVKVR